MSGHKPWSEIRRKSDLSVSQSVKIRPVYKRYLKRKHHMQPGLPTELEKRDAIAVMQECYPAIFEIEEILLIEAERILHESDVESRKEDRDRY